MTPAELHALAARVETEDRRCETCDLWKQHTDDYGYCLWNAKRLPYWHKKASEGGLTRAFDGAACPTWEPKPCAMTEVEELRAEVARLREMVRHAYNAGFSEGMREHSTSRGGKPWPDSGFPEKLEALRHDPR